MALQGHVERADRNLVQGWAYDPEASVPAVLVVSVDDVRMSSLVANIYRQDLEQAGLADGRHGFLLQLQGLSPICPHTIRVIREADGTDVPGSPVVVLAAASFDSETQDRLAMMFADAQTDAELAQRAAFLAQQADRLLQLRADRRSFAPDPTSRRLFRARWSGHTEPGGASPVMRALMIDERLPDASRDADSQAVLSHIHSLQRLGYEVVLAPSDLRGGAEVAALAAVGVSCCCGPWTGSIEELLRREQSAFALVYLHRGGNLRYLPLIRHHQPRARLLYSVAELDHLRLSRQAEVEQRPELVEASRQTRMMELSGARLADAVITHSVFEAELLRRDVPDANIHLVPWAVAPHATKVPWADRRGFAFIGHYRREADLDAAWWLIQEVMPRVRAADPGIDCMLVGSDMPDALQAVVTPGICPIGRLRSLPDLFDQIRLTVAPLAFGAGLSGMVLQSWAAGIPCACTPLAVEGMNLSASLRDMVASDAAGLAELVLRLHRDEAFNDACSAAGLAHISKTISEAQLDAMMRNAIGPRHANPARPPPPGPETAIEPLS